MKQQSFTPEALRSINFPYPFDKDTSIVQLIMLDQNELGYLLHQASKSGAREALDEFTNLDSLKITTDQTMQLLGRGRKKVEEYRKLGLIVGHKKGESQNCAYEYDLKSVREFLARKKIGNASKSTARPLSNSSRSTRYKELKERTRTPKKDQ